MLANKHLLFAHIILQNGWQFMMTSVVIRPGLAVINHPLHRTFFRWHQFSPQCLQLYTVQYRAILMQYADEHGLATVSVFSYRWIDSEYEKHNLAYTLVSLHQNSYIGHDGDLILNIRCTSVSIVTRFYVSSILCSRCILAFSRTFALCTNNFALNFMSLTACRW